LTGWRIKPSYLAELHVVAVLRAAKPALEAGPLLLPLVARRERFFSQNGASLRIKHAAIVRLCAEYQRCGASAALLSAVILHRAKSSF
jgi:hypothetical protein